MSSGPILSGSLAALRRRSVQLWIGFLGVLFVYLAVRGAVLVPDTESYLGKNPVRSGGYPLFIGLFQTVCGAGRFLPVVLVQVALGFTTVVLLTRTLARIFELDAWIVSAIGLVLLMPYFTGTGNNIASEALAYPLFLLAVRALLAGLVERNVRSLLLFFGWNLLLVFTRRQFLFMHVVGLFAVVYVFFLVEKLPRRGLVALALIGAIFVGELVERVYHYGYHGRFKATPFTGMHLVIGPLYVSQPDDAALFADPAERALFTDVRAEMEAAHLVREPGGGFINPYLYQRSFDVILYRHLKPALPRHGFIEPFQIDAALVSMGLRLARANARDYAVLYALNVINYLGGYYFFVLIALCFVGAGWAHYRNRDPVSLGLFLATLIAIGNATLTSIVQSIQQRYSIYPNGLLVSMFVIALSSLARRAHSRAEEDRRERNVAG